MEFVIKKSDLVRELQTVTGVVERRTVQPILANLLLEAEKSKLLIGASDLEVTIRGKANADVVREGGVTLPAGKLHEIARSLPESDVRFKLGERNQVSIQCERVRYRIAGQPKEEFPAFPEVDESRGVPLPGRLLHGMIERVAFAITPDDPRYALQGALLVLEGGTLTLVATDTHRLAFCSRRLEEPRPATEARVIVPRKALAQVAKMTADMEVGEPILFGHADNHVFFAVREHKLTCNVVKGNFPRYENVMPKSCGTTLTAPTEELLQAVRRVSLLGSEHFGRAIQVNLGRGKLELSSRTEMGEAQETLALDYEGQDVTIGFNARYLLDFLGVVGTPLVRLDLDPQRDGEGELQGEAKVNPGDKPGQFRPVDEELDYRYVVMPMHL